MMKIFKSIKIIAGALTAFMLIILQGCSDLLEPEIFDRAEASKFPQNEKELLSTVGATYGALRGYYDPVTVLNSATSDEMVVPTRGPDWFDNASWQQLAKHDWTPVSPGQINGSWEWAYRVIAGSNINIRAISESTLQVQGKEAILAELRLLRAFGYFTLLDMFGSVPIITEKSPVGKATQNTRAEVYAFVAKEITEALPNLRDEKGVQIYGRFTKGAANTLLAKLYLNAQVYTGTPRWQEALAATNAVISSPAGYALTPNYLDNFAVN
ncbi:RagB/SusD family nutrient uptake outer membrane protein, partial [Daejeonella sp.]|uniref:RagB/SusD family nutrient uptake outer membrane protein n=1 Tax=Daejeonella sp. TaxID=2805397 RepID=UPI003983294A